MKKLLSILIAWLFLFQSTWAFAGTHYVSATGSASWANSTDIGQPCSVTTAEANADDDDIVYFLDTGGEYDGESLRPANSGSSGHPITFKNYTGDTPTFDGENVGLLLALTSIQGHIS